MTESGYQNFDYGLARKILDLLKVPYVFNVTVINNNFFFIHLSCLFWLTYNFCAVNVAENIENTSGHCVKFEINSSVTANGSRISVTIKTTTKHLTL